MPVYELDDNFAIELDGAGRPSGSPVEELVLPDANGKSNFCCRCGRETYCGQGLTLSAGTVLVFSFADEPGDSDIVLARHGGRGKLGRVIRFKEGDRVIFEPAGGTEPPKALRVPLAEAGYKAVARYETC